MMARWFDRPLNTRRSGFRLYCFPYAGGSSNVYRSWGVRAPAEMEIIGVELPGRGNRIAEPLLPHLDALAFEAAEAIASTGDTRFALFGHSMGALIAFEVTRRLRARGGPVPHHLFVSGCAAPHCERSRRPVAMMSTAEFVAMLRDLNGTPDSVLHNPELMELVIPVLKSDFTAVDGWNYRPDRPLNIPITAFAGRSDPHVKVEAVRDWQHHTRHEFQCRVLSGDHFFVHSNEATLLDFMSREVQVETCA
jgi:medium-chain acyl-[acyl-carrier-protein] hydrolase